MLCVLAKTARFVFLFCLLQYNQIKYQDICHMLKGGICFCFFALKVFSFITCVHYSVWSWRSILMKILYCQLYKQLPLWQGVAFSDTLYLEAETVVKETNRVWQVCVSMRSINSNCSKSSIEMFQCLLVVYGNLELPCVGKLWRLQSAFNRNLVIFFSFDFSK